MKVAILGLFCVLLDTASCATILDHNLSFRWSPRIKKLEADAQQNVSFTKFNTYEEIVDYVRFLTKNYPDIVESEMIGYSVEKRPIYVVRVSGAGNKEKPSILVDAGIHAREWAAPAMAQYLLFQLVENYKNNKDIVDNIDWHVIPIVNPDGYKYSMEKNRLWRKNRAITPNPRCSGVDLNRNFDVHFGGEGTSTDPCSETYIGEGPFSEPESRAIRDYALALKGKIPLYLTLHSFGKYLLYPWGYADERPQDWKDLDALAKLAERSVFAVRGTHYKVGTSTQLLGAAAGGSDDWMKAKGGAKYSYTIELPGGGRNGFDLPAYRILNISSEMFQGIKRMAIFIAHEAPTRRRG